MTDLIPAISQLGFPIVIATFLLWDYSKKLASIQIQLVKMTDDQENHDKIQEKILARLESIERKLHGTA
jgi:hypothetical protein